VFQTLITFLTRDLGRVPELNKVGIETPFQGFGIDDPGELGRVNPDLQFVEGYILARTPEHFRGFSPKFRIILHLLRLRKH